VGRVFIGADHGGYELKQAILSQYGDFVDCGNFEADPDDNFPDFAKEVCRRVLDTPNSLGLIICGTGIGVSICANRHRGIRAALCHNVDYARLARQHNDANVLCLGGRFMDKKTAFAVVDVFLKTERDKNPKYKKRMEMADGIV